MIREFVGGGDGGPNLAVKSSSANSARPPRFSCSVGFLCHSMLAVQGKSLRVRFAIVVCSAKPQYIEATKAIRRTIATKDTTIPNKIGSFTCAKLWAFLARAFARKGICIEKWVVVLMKMMGSELKRGQTCTFQTRTLFSARFLALTTSRLPSEPSLPPPLLSIASTLSELKWTITSPRRVKQCRDVTKNKMHVRKVHVSHPLKSGQDNPTAWCTYHPFQDHYTHEIIIFKLFKGLQLQLSGVFRINSHYSHSFLVFLQNGVAGNHSPREFPSIFGNYSYMI